MEENNISIKEKIDIVIKEEFKKMMDNPELNPLLRLIIDENIDIYYNKLDDLVEHLKKQDIGRD